ncbi:SDR family NAD(P)-dependent oxidoreductase [Lichenicoccus sp.]|uniref:SDR family NAD(P)-dependent oxidoreductase n=1 Tax=Lichenicoccus sp. TaxID=2781899 RepID=UPI003D0A186C
MALRDLNGRLVLVTGAASGIGFETALAFARKGADIAAVDLDEARLADISQRVIAMGRRCATFGCDVGDSEAVAALGSKVTAIATPDVVVNNAGVAFLGPFLETPASAWEQVIRVNLLGVVNVSRAFLPSMLKAGGSRHLVNVASAAGLHAVANLSAYSASKHAVIGFSDCLAMELARTTICVTVVCPGIINTPIVRNRKAVAASVPASALDRLDRQYQAKGVHPSIVGRRIVRAVRRDEDIVLVGPTAAAVFHMRRLSRPLLRKAGISGARQLGYIWADR